MGNQPSSTAAAGAELRGGQDAPQARQAVERAQLGGESPRQVHHLHAFPFFTPLDRLSAGLFCFLLAVRRLHACMHPCADVEVQIYWVAANSADRGTEASVLHP